MTRCIVSVCFLKLALTANAQGFINLGFNDVDLSNLNFDPLVRAQFGTPSKLLNGWQIAINGSPINKVWYNPFGVFTGPPGVTVGRVPETFPADFGAYALIENGFILNGSQEGSVEIRIGQAAEIPIGARQLRFYSSVSPIVYIDGKQVDYDQVGQFLYVTPYSGRRVDLEFAFPNKLGNLTSTFDIIGFVPEPTTMSLLVLGTAAVFGLQMYRRGAN